VALMAVGWVAALVSEFAIGWLSHLGLLGDIGAGLGVLTFPGFTFWLVPGLLLDIVLQSREAARLVTLSATLVYIALVVATAIWFWLSRRAPMRRRATVMAVLIVAGPLGYVASMPLAGNVFGFVMLNAISGGGYYE
jgi:hypothetical protein